jgi:hypothetical protein
MEVQELTLEEMKEVNGGGLLGGLLGSNCCNDCCDSGGIDIKVKLSIGICL